MKNQEKSFSKEKELSVEERNAIADKIEQHQKEHEGRPQSLNMTVKMLRNNNYSTEAVKNDYLIDRDKLEFYHKKLRDYLDKKFGVEFKF